MANPETIEEWRPVEGWPYEVSDLGRVRRAARGPSTYIGRILKPAIVRWGYHRVTFSQNNKKIRFYVQGLVCRAFHGEPPSPEHQAAHQDGNTGNNIPGNLRWATIIENRADEIKRGVRPAGEGHALTKVSDDVVREIRNLHSSGVSIRELERRFPLERTQITRIVKGLARLYSNRPGIDVSVKRK